MNPGPSRAYDETGAVAIMVAIMATVLFGLAALVVDLGQARDVRRQAQNAADASALAAGNVLKAGGTMTAAAEAARDYAQRNYGVDPVTGWAGCTDAGRLAVPSSVTPCISFDSATAPTQVRVVMPQRDVNTPLAGVLGASRVAVSALAQASVKPGGMADCGLCIIGESDHNVSTGNVYVDGTDVQANGTLDIKKDFVVTDGTLAVEHGATKKNKSNVTPWPVTTGVHVSDPLASLPMPDLSGFSDKQDRDPCSGSGGPGIYSDFSSASSCTLQPGLYVITGGTHLSGHHDLRGEGVTLFFTCGTSAGPQPCTDDTSWDFEMTSQNTDLNLTAPTESTATHGAVPGVAIIADRGWTGTLSFQGGGGDGTLAGTIYLAAGALHYGGNSDDSVVDSLIVVNDFDMNGNSASLHLKTTADANVQIPPSDLHLTK